MEARRPGSGPPPPGPAARSVQAPDRSSARLTYFAGYGLAEQTRWIMAAAGIPFEQAGGGVGVKGVERTRRSSQAPLTAASGGPQSLNSKECLELAQLVTSFCLVGRATFWVALSRCFGPMRPKTETVRSAESGGSPNLTFQSQTLHATGGPKPPQCGQTPWSLWGFLLPGDFPQSVGVFVRRVFRRFLLYHR